MPWCALLSYLHNHDPRNTGQGVVRWSLSWSDAEESWRKLDRSSQQLGLWFERPNVHRVRLSLPVTTRRGGRDEWFASLLSRECPDLDRMRNRLRHLQGLLWVAIVHLNPSVLFQGPLTTLNREQKLLWEFLKWPADAAFFTAIANQIYVLDTPQEVLSHECEGRVKTIGKHPGVCFLRPQNMDDVFATNRAAKATISVQALLDKHDLEFLPAVVMP